MFSVNVIPFPEIGLQVVEVVSEQPSYTPADISSAIAAIESASVDLRKGVVISHRGAIWMHSAIAHHFHPAAWVAHYDPRLGGAVVVQSHKPGVSEGSVIEIAL